MVDVSNAVSTLALRQPKYITLGSVPLGEVVVLSWCNRAVVSAVAQFKRRHMHN